jgi:hypothetical protein
MRLDEFYNPENDKFSSRKIDDSRKPTLTLGMLNKLRKVRDIKKAEQLEYNKFVSTMYSAPASGGGL